MDATQLYLGRSKGRFGCRIRGGAPQDELIGVGVKHDIGTEDGAWRARVNGIGDESDV